MFYKEIYNPRPSDYNRNGKLSYEAILQLLENAAGNHSANSGDSIADANKNGIAWILTEWRVQILHRPENGESLNITTWVRGKAPASAVRSTVHSHAMSVFLAAFFVFRNMSTAPAFLGGRRS